MDTSVLALSMVTPSLLLLWYFHSRDVHPEPAAVVWRTFALGVLTAIPVLAFALPMGAFLGDFTDPFSAGVYEAFVLAAIPEEICKLAVLVWYVRRQPAFDEPMDGLVYGVAASLGFATLENVLYVSQGGLGVASLRAVTSIPGHATFGAIMGYFVGQAHFTRGRSRSLMLKALMIPILLHGLYDTPLMIAKGAREAGHENIVGVLLGTVPLVLGISVITALRMGRRLRLGQLARGAVLPPGSLTLALTPTAEKLNPRWSLTAILGGLLASVGGLVALGSLLMVVSGAAAEAKVVGPVLIFGALFGVGPLVGGLAVFSRGVQRLHSGPR